MIQLATVVVAIALMLVAAARTEAVAPEGEPFQRTWARTDKPVADGRVSRTWMWGPEAFEPARREVYAEGHNGSREVQYFDKARMEITTDQSVPYESIWFVTNGLLVTELMTGQMQVGNTQFETHLPANVPVAGDPDDDLGPRYATLALALDDPALGEGTGITAVMGPSGNISHDPTLVTLGITAAKYVPETKHTVASVFWEFMNAEGMIYADDQYTHGKLFESPFYATGFPLTEAYWTTVRLNDVATRVLVQAFQRRVLTYTPTNPAGWQVEAGNVGQHYHRWRYVQVPAEQTPTPTPTETATATETATETQTATETPTTPTIVGMTGYMQMEYISVPLPGSSDYQRIVIRNMQVAGDINMAGWSLRDDEGNVYVFPDFIVQEGFYVEVRSGNGQDRFNDKGGTVYTGMAPLYDGDRVYLVDPFGEVIDTYE
jgi:hypothetical protein